MKLTAQAKKIILLLLVVVALFGRLWYWGTTLNQQPTSTKQRVAGFCGTFICQITNNTYDTAKVDFRVVVSGSDGSNPTVTKVNAYNYTFPGDSGTTYTCNVTAFTIADPNNANCTSASGTASVKCDVGISPINSQPPIEI